MFRTIVIFGAIGGLIVCSPFVVLVTTGRYIGEGSYLFGYLLMLIALSMVFVGVKRVRDRDGGGVIRFLPALGVGLGISVVASLFYTIGWELTLHATHFAFLDTYSAGIIEVQRAKDASPAAMARAAAKAAAFRTQYANPLYRLPEAFIEIFPVGVVISLISAAVLRNSRILPARRAAA
ncbi:MAG: DUF4199 domain-containing protein [Phenylobacterium sp.]|nr:MAG: DUF4199 domain-containing protein [Phenylobacterium sp.]